MAVATQRIPARAGPTALARRSRIALVSHSIQNSAAFPLHRQHLDSFTSTAAPRRLRFPSHRRRPRQQRRRPSDESTSDSRSTNNVAGMREIVSATYSKQSCPIRGARATIPRGHPLTRCARPGPSSDRPMCMYTTRRALVRSY